MPSGLGLPSWRARGQIDEPGLEQGLGDGFEGGVGFAQEGDVVVEGLHEVKSPAAVCASGWNWEYATLRRSPSVIKEQQLVPGLFVSDLALGRNAN